MAVGNAYVNEQLVSWMVHLSVASLPSAEEQHISTCLFLTPQLATFVGDNVLRFWVSGEAI